MASKEAVEFYDRGDVSSSETTAYEKARCEEGRELADDEDAVKAYPHNFRTLVVVPCITLACFLMLLDNTVIVGAVPKITTDFRSINNVGWYGAAYELSSAVLNPLTGKVFANFNLKWTFLVFTAIFELGSLLCGAANGPSMLIAGRAVAGLGSAGIQTGTMIIITACVAPQRRPTITGIVMGLAQLGFVAGPLISGALTQYSTWRWCFYLNLPCGAVVAVLLLFGHIPELEAKPSPREVLRHLFDRFDLFGAALFAPPCVLLLLAVQWGGVTYPWDSSIIIGMLVGAGVSFLIWFAWNYYRKDLALIPVALMSKRHVWSGCLAYGLMMSSLICALYYMPLYFQSVRGVGATLSGVYMLPILVSAVVGAIIAGIVVERIGYYIPVMWLMSVCMSVGFGLLSTLSLTTSTGKWIGYQLLVGFGRGFGLQMPFIAVQHNAAPSEIPIVTALLIFAQTFGCSLALGFSDTILANTLQKELRNVLSNSTVNSIIAAGGVGFRTQVSPSQLPTVISAYLLGIDRVFYLTAAFAAASFFAACGMGWKDIRQKPAAQSAA